MSKNESLVTAMWPIFGTMRLLGLFPVKRARDKLELSLVWCFVSLIIVSLQVIPGFFLVYRGLTLLPQQDQDMHFSGYVALTTVGLTLVSVLLTFICIPFHLNFYQRLNKFQFSHNEIQRNTSFCKLNRWSRFVPFLVPLPVFFSVGSRTLVTKEFKFALDLYLGIVTGYDILMLALWRGTMHAMKIYSGVLLDQYKKVIEECGLALEDDKSAVLAYRDLWLQLCDLVRDSGNFLMLSYSLLLVVDVACLIYTLYELLSCPGLVPAIFFTVYLLFLLVFLNSFCNDAHDVTSTVHRNLMEGETVTEAVMPISCAVKFQMVQFFTTVSRNSPEITLRGYVTMGRSLLYHLIPALVSDVVVLIQFNIAKKKLDSIGFFTFGDFVTYSK